jgi:hypothetical protein
MKDNQRPIECYRNGDFLFAGQSDTFEPIAVQSTKNGVDFLCELESENGVSYYSDITSQLFASALVDAILRRYDVRPGQLIVLNERQWRDIFRDRFKDCCDSNIQYGIYICLMSILTLLLSSYVILFIAGVAAFAYGIIVSSAIALQFISLLGAIVMSSGIWCCAALVRKTIEQMRTSIRVVRCSRKFTQGRSPFLSELPYEEIQKAIQRRM